VIDLRYELDLTTMGFGDLTNNRQTQSTASLFAPLSRVASPETLEHSILVNQINPWALIFNGHPRPWTFEAAAKPNRGSFG
jgi:hypothetical protein